MLGVFDLQYYHILKRQKCDRDKERLTQTTPTAQRLPKPLFNISYTCVTKKKSIV